jgi:hypothetical protein
MGLEGLFAQSTNVGWGPALLHAAIFKELLPFVLTPPLFLGLAWQRSLGTIARRLYLAMVVATVAAFGSLCLARAAGNVTDPPDWDVKAFWLYGKVAAERANFYEPAALHRVAGETGLRPDDPLFTDAVLDVGFPYPPPAILLIAPFGHLDPRSAALAWYMLHGIAFVAVVFLLGKAFMRGAGGMSWVALAALLLILRPTYATVAFGQTNFLLLALLLLFARSQERMRGGAWLALAIAVKPVVAPLLAYAVLRRQWRSVAGAAATFAALCLVTVALYGIDVFASYLATNPVSRLPAFIYSIDENQSLLAELIRSTNDAPAAIATLPLHPYYIAVLLIVGATAAAVVQLLPKRHEPLALSVALTAVLLIYPQSWEHYTVLLILPMLVLWKEREVFELSTAAAIVLLSAVYALLRYDSGHVAVYGTSLLWIALLFVCGRLLIKREIGYRGSTVSRVTILSNNT